MSDADINTTAEVAPTSRRRAMKVALLVVLALLWIRIVLFGMIYPVIEEKYDNPEFDVEPTEEVASLPRH